MRAAIALLLAGCAIPRAPEPASDAVFPHVARYVDTHGGDLADHPIALCATCHTDTSDVAPACTSCHASYPHPAGWRAGARHGVDDAATCAGCHDNAGAAPSCTSCHASFPHPGDWAEQGHHGTYALARGGTDACATCHGADLAGGTSGVACTTCHAAYPHPAGFVAPTAHGADFTAAPAGCQGCHGADLAGGTSGVACTTCHAAFPHPTGWRATHLGAARASGEAACLTCHAPGDGGPDRVATCSASCHGG